MIKYSFVILLPYISQTITDLCTFDLQILENESDLDLGYFTIQGENQSIQEFKSFLNGTNFI
jgi:hypothetical protein